MQRNSWRLLVRGSCAERSFRDHALDEKTHWVHCPPHAGKMLRKFLLSAKLRPVSGRLDHTAGSNLLLRETLQPRSTTAAASLHRIHSISSDKFMRHQNHIQVATTSILFHPKKYRNTEFIEHESRGLSYGM